MTIETNTPEVWVTGKPDPVTAVKTIATSLDLPARTPVGQVASTGHFADWDPSATNGSAVAVGITAYDIDTTGGAQSHEVFMIGTFNPELVNWPDGTTDLQKATAFTGTPINLQEPRP